MKTGIESRALPIRVSNMRAEARGDKKIITGYAAVFYREGDTATQYELFPGLVERIFPGAFDAAIREDDVRGLANHMVESLLGRRKPGDAASTMRLSVDATGLIYEIDVPDTEIGRSVYESIRRGDMDGSSFSFATDVSWGAKRGDVTWREVDGTTIRQIHSLELFDVGPVTFPAYKGATAGVRSNTSSAAVLKERDAWLAAQRSAEIDEDADDLLLAAEIASPLVR